MKPITREEMFLAAAAGYDVTPPEPVTRKEKFLAKLAGMEVETPTVFTRQERLLDEAASRAPSVTINNQDITVTENGQYTADEGYTGLGTVTVEVPDEPAVLEDLEVTENGNYTPSDGVDGFGSVTVNVPDAPAVVQPLEITENGTYTAPDGVDGYSPVTVNVPTPEINLQDKTITENGTYTADSGFDGLGSVEVNVKGGGGLPVGGYWGPFDDVPRPNAYNWIFAELGGELYAFTPKTNAETNTGINYKFKMVDGAWVQLADETFVDANMYAIRFVEFNGKLHFVPKQGSKYHWTFDGTAMVKMGDLPKSIYIRSLFVQDNKLKMIYGQTVYVWDEATDTWTTEATLSAIGAYTYAGVYVVDGVVYMVDQKNVFIYANKAVTQYATTTKDAGATNYTAVVNGKLYYYNGDSLKGTSLYCFNFATKTDRLVTKVPAWGTYGNPYLKSYQGKLLSLYTKPTYGSIFQLYEVTE